MYLGKASTAVKKSQEYFKLCMNSTAVEEMGFTPALKVSGGQGHDNWPENFTLDSEIEICVDVGKILSLLKKVFAPKLLHIYLFLKMKASMVHYFEFKKITDGLIITKCPRLDLVLVKTTKRVLVLPHLMLSTEGLGVHEGNRSDWQTVMSRIVSMVLRLSNTLAGGFGLAS